MSGNGELLFEVETELEEVFQQFRQSFYFSQVTRIAQELAVNLDLPARRSEMVEASLQNAWPWPNCMANNPFNQQSWRIEGVYSPVTMLVGTDGTIRYVGPIGGFLPQMLVKQETELVMAAQMEATTDGGAEMQQLLDQAQQMLQGQSAEIEEAVDEDSAGESTAEAPVQQRQSNAQAANILRGAQAQRILSPRRACQLCDDVLDTYPDSLEADEARLMIESMLRRNNRLREEREAQGLYVGP